MALTIRRVFQETKPYTILDALEDYLGGEKRGTLMFISVETGKGFRVLGYDRKTRIVRLHTGYKKQVLHPVISERECELYYPLWR